MWKDFPRISFFRLSTFITRYCEANFFLILNFQGNSKKKESFKTITIIGFVISNKKGKSFPDYSGPIGLDMLKFSISSISFFITNTGKFHGLVDSFICFNSSCSFTSCSIACNFSLVNGSLLYPHRLVSQPFYE